MVEVLSVFDIVLFSYFVKISLSVRYLTSDTTEMYVL